MDSNTTDEGNEQETAINVIEITREMYWQLQQQYNIAVEKKQPLINFFGCTLNRDYCKYLLQMLADHFDDGGTRH